MKPYQESYLNNMEMVSALMEVQRAEGLTAESFYEDRVAKAREIRARVEENMVLLREHLIPLLDDIVSAGREDITDLMEFAAQLMSGQKQMDIGLPYLIHSALIAYARHKNDRCLLIRELYQTAMALYYLQAMLDAVGEDKYRWRMRMLFGEAAGFIRYYDEIEDVETRGYIHRSMGNLALGYNSNVDEEAVKKLDVIRRSLQILNDPVYQAKTPQLPWDAYIYKSHQERTTMLTYLRHGITTDSIVREIMASAEFVHNRQLKSAREKGTKLEPRWLYAYYAASYHCGFNSLQEFFANLEEIYASVSVTDYSQQGIYANVYVPGLYSSYVGDNPQFMEKKKPVLSYMYRNLVRYVKSVPNSLENERMFFYLRGTMNVFIEYPDGILLKDYICEMIAGRYPASYVHSQMVGHIARLLLDRALDLIPDVLLGVRGLDTAEELRAHRRELLDFIYDCGILHDIGKLNFLNLISLGSRKWIEEEDEIVEFHTCAGKKVLERCKSTADYVDAALGHHRWYDGKGGYPEAYDRTKVRDAALVDIICIADYLDLHTDGAGNYFESPMPLREALEKLNQQGGTRFAPHFAAIALQAREELEAILDKGRRRAYEAVYKALLRDSV